MIPKQYPQMAEYIILKHVVLGSKHVATGQTRHYLGTEILPLPSELSIAQYPGDSGFYLLYFDSSGKELTDTYHDSVENAMAQADFEFQVKPSDWQDVTVL